MALTDSEKIRIAWLKSAKVWTGGEFDWFDNLLKTAPGATLNELTTNPGLLYDAARQVKLSHLTNSDHPVDGKVERIVSDPKWPEATVTVVCVDMTDTPLNPNPASRQRHICYQLMLDGRKFSTPTFSLPGANMAARELHRKTVQRLSEEQRQQNPNYGRFD